MPLPLRDPALFPAFVAQSTIAFDEGALGEPAAQFPGVTLPASLAGAVKKRQLEFLAGRWCAREALRRCGADDADRSIPSGENREPVWPAGVVGAITHTHGYASVAVARSSVARGIGIDAESWIPEGRAASLSSRLAGAGEVEAIAEATGFTFGRALTLLFSAKETIFKCLYPEVQRYFHFHDAVIVGVDLAKGEFAAKLLTTLTPTWEEGRGIEGRFVQDERLICTGVLLSP